MKKTKKLFISMLLLLALSVAPQASANSAVHRWQGVTSGGAILTDGDCPVMVTKEELVFYPDTEFSNTGRCGCVEAGYTFYNSSSADVTAHLLFPFETSGYSGTSVKAADCHVTENDAEIKKTLHYVYGSQNGFDVSEYISSFSEECLSDEYYNKDTPVYTYSLYLKTESEKDLTAVYEGPVFGASGYGIIGDFRTGFHDKNTARYDTWKDEDYRVTFIGEDLIDQYLSHLKFYEDYEHQVESSGTISIMGSTEGTLYNYFMQWHDDEMSSTDWFNGCFSYLRNSEDSAMYSSWNNEVKSNMLASLYYSISVMAKETITNKVTVPLYPSEESYNSKYTFSYLLSPASSFGSFSDLTITIVTDMKISKMSLSFSETKEGYQYHSDSLPKNDLSFTLCTNANSSVPNRISSGWCFVLTILMAIVAAIEAVMLWLVFSKRKSVWDKGGTREKIHFWVNAAENMAFTVILLFGLVYMFFIPWYDITSVICIILSVLLLYAEIFKAVLRNKVGMRTFWPFIILTVCFLVFLLIEQFSFAGVFFGLLASSFILSIYQVSDTNHII